MPTSTTRTRTTANHPAEPSYVCIRCASAPGVINIHSRSSEVIVKWCQECFTQHGFSCQGCDKAFNNDEIHNPEDGEGPYCEFCHSDYYTSCENCGCELHNESDERQSAGDYNYCSSCYEDLFFYCNWCEESKEKNEFSRLPLANGSRGHDWICGQCLEEERNTHPDKFVQCHRTQEWICMENPSTYFLINGEPTSRAWAISNLSPSDRTRLEREMQLHAPRMVARGILGDEMRREIRPNISSMQSLLINKAKNTLAQCPAPSVSPVHNRIYIGMEIECFGGKFFTYNKSKAPKGKSIDMGPHKLLHRLLPAGTRMVHDGSIQGPNGQEFLPPIVKKKTDWKKIERTIKGLKELEWDSNSTCGLHFHFSHASITPDNPKLVKEIFRIFYFLEPIIFQCLPKNRRDNEYCKPIAKYFKPEEIKQDIKLDYWYYGNFWKKHIRRPNDHNSHPPFTIRNTQGQVVDHVNFGDCKMTKENMEIMKTQDHYFVGRYIGCNLHALYQKGTIELRYFPSILEFSYVYAWAQMMAQVFAFALKGNTHNKIEEISKSGMDFEGKLKNIGTLFGWKTAMVKFLTNEYKTYRKDKEGKVNMLTGETDQIDPENRRLRHMEQAILGSEPIPEPNPQEREPQPETRRNNRFFQRVDPLAHLLPNTNPPWERAYQTMPMTTISQQVMDGMIEEALSTDLRIPEPRLETEDDNA